MRWSNLFVPTLRDAPGDAEAVSHKLLVRGGFIRQMHAGHYNMLPLGWKVHEKVAGIVREEMNAIGGQEFLLPAMHPKSLWEASGRWETMGDEMFRLQDRSGTDVALGMTHEEAFAQMALEINSYKALPQIWYQIQWKFRDEPRPKAGLLRVREFTMKDSYSLDIDTAGLDVAFDKHHAAYLRIFERLGVDAMPVEASSGAMGGSGSIEFMVASPSGEDDVVRCPNCDYRANIERAISALPPIDDEVGPDAPEKFATPGIRTIKALEEAGAPATSQMKSMIMMLDDEMTIAVVRGDHQLNIQKLQDTTGAIDIRPATPEETLKHLGARPGSLGAVGVPDDITILVDHALEGRTNLTTGANEDDWHYRGVDVSRDVNTSRFVDLREVSAGEACPKCETPLEIVRAIEAGHIFKLGTKYAEAMGAHVLDADGDKRTIVMGSYGIGVGRNMAAIAETHADEKGLVWPVSVAPFEVVVTVMKIDDEATMNAAEKIYEELLAAGIDVLIDDRDARAGVKFADSELIGIPFRVTVGPRGIADGNVEYTVRSTMETTEVGADAIVAMVVDAVQTNK
ncbi:MAG: proline--tRNA ligase [Acidimicrobiia bacterium]|nr:proline--tRNA ligase [Acidimicrobiia bacterium]